MLICPAPVIAAALLSVDFWPYVTICAAAVAAAYAIVTAWERAEAEHNEKRKEGEK